MRSHKANLHAKRCAEDAGRTCKKDVDCGVPAPCLGKIVASIPTTGPLGRDRLDTVVEDELCIPSLALDS